MIEISKSYLDKLINTDKLGASGYAFKRKDALNILNEDFLNGYHISGGDVLEINNNEIKFTYDSWSTEPIKNENRNDYITRCKNNSEKYISNYNEGNRNIIYLLVIHNG